jgi:predicted transcriptional regulator
MIVSRKFMSGNEKIAGYFLELASEQRLDILSELLKKPNRVNVIAKKLRVTPQEVHRNLDRLNHAGMVAKGLEDHYRITSVGKIMLSQMSLVSFLSKNKTFFDTHDLNDVPTKFTKRLGVLEECKHIKGVTAVLEKWRTIYSESEKYVCDILSESPPETITPLLKRIAKGVEYRHVISKQFLEPAGRNQMLEKMGYYKFIEGKKIQRRETKSVSVILIMNEKEGGIIFSTSSDEPDLRSMFYGKSAGFHEWCHDYFEYIWKKSKKIPNQRINKK